MCDVCMLQGKSELKPGPAHRCYGCGGGVRGVHAPQAKARLEEGMGTRHNPPDHIKAGETELVLVEVAARNDTHKA